MKLDLMLFLGSILFLVILGAEIFLQFRYFIYYSRKKRRIFSRINTDENIRKNSQDILKTHGNVKHPIGYALIPGSSAEFTNPDIFPGPFKVFINSQGLREDEITPEQIRCGSFNCVFLGDSVTFGSGSSLENTIVKRCQAWLNKTINNPFCLNFGVGGYSILESLLSVKYRKAFDYDPKYIIFNLTIKSLFDFPRMNLPGAGYHIEARKKTFLAHYLYIKMRGGKIKYLLRELKKFDRICRNKKVKFVINFLPACFKGGIYSLSTYNRFQFLKYKEAFELMKKIAADNDLDTWDFSAKFINTPDCRAYFRKSLNKGLTDYQVHFSDEGNDFMGKLISENILSGIQTEIQPWGRNERNR